MGEGVPVEDELSKQLYAANNKYLTEQRAHLRLIAACAKSLEKDLRSLSQMNDNAKNSVMGFNDARLDEQQRLHTSSEASKEFITIYNTVRQMMPVIGESTKG